MKCMEKGGENKVKVPVDFNFYFAIIQHRERPMEHYIQRVFLGLKLNNIIRVDCGLILDEFDNGNNLRYRLVNPRKMQLEGFPPLPGFIDGEINLYRDNNRISSVRLNMESLILGAVNWLSLGEAVQLDAVNDFNLCYKFEGVNQNGLEESLLPLLFK